MNVILTEQLKTGQILKEVLSRFVHLTFLKSNSFYKGLIKLSELKGFLISRGHWKNLTDLEISSLKML